MTTTYTLRIPVQAWRVQPDGSLPEGARFVIMQHRGVRTLDGWMWRTRLIGEMHARAGDWMMLTPYGLWSITDEDFRASCTEVTP